jgi:hypothetical protein
MKKREPENKRHQVFISYSNEKDDEKCLPFNKFPVNVFLQVINEKRQHKNEGKGQRHLPRVARRQLEQQSRGLALRLSRLRLSLLSLQLRWLPPLPGQLNFFLLPFVAPLPPFSVLYL